MITELGAGDFTTNDSTSSENNCQQATKHHRLRDKRSSITPRSSLFLFMLMCSMIFALSMLPTCEAADRVLNFYIPNESALRASHHTHLFRSSTWFIFRRANDIAFRVQLDSQLKPGQSMSLQVAPYSIVSTKSLKINHISGGTYDITCRIPHDAPIGIFSIGIRLSDQRVVRQLPKQIALLFNPWSVETLEYFPRTAELAEYVESEHSITYRGSTAQVQDVRWYLGQFSQESLSVTLYAVNRLTEEQRKDPAEVSRHLTRFSAYQEGQWDGLLYGKWEGGFGGGTNPSSWSSSDQIFRTYIAQGFNTVRYGQCWVFGGVLHAMLRCLGLASVQISVFDSCHEYAAERPGIYMQRIGRYFEQNGRWMVAETGKIWNFHSWNLAYFQNVKTDYPYLLPDWQNLDATPQEFSHTGDYRLGPSPLKAVRELQKAANFDTSFVMSEVNARYHSFLVQCQYLFGGGQKLPPGCKVVQDLGASAHVPSGTYIVSKSVNGFYQMPWTHLFHNRALSPAEDPNLRHRFPAVRAFDTMGLNADNDDADALMSRRHRSNTFSTMSTITGQPIVTNAPATTVAVHDAQSGKPLAAVPAAVIDSSFEQPIALTAKDVAVDAATLINTHDDNEVDWDAVGEEKVAVHGHIRLSASEIEAAAFEAQPGELDKALFTYEDTGVGMGIIIPPVQIGEPLEVFLNFACESQTAQFESQLHRTDRSTKVITLHQKDLKNGAATDDDDDEEDNMWDPQGMSPANKQAPKCPSVALISFRLQLLLTDYTARSLGTIGDVQGELVLRQVNGYFQSYRIIVDDYVKKALEHSQEKHEGVPQYIRAVVMANDHTTLDDRDIVMIAERKSVINFPPIELIADRTTFEFDVDHQPIAIAGAADQVDDINAPMFFTADGNAADMKNKKELEEQEAKAAEATAKAIIDGDKPVENVFDIDASGVRIVPSIALRAMEENRPDITTPEQEKNKATRARVTLKYTNKLPFALHNAELALQADNMGFAERKITLGDIAPGVTVKYVHEWCVANALPGLHYYHAVITSDELEPVRGEIDLSVKKAYGKVAVEEDMAVVDSVSTLAATLMRPRNTMNTLSLVGSAVDAAALRNADKTALLLEKEQEDALAGGNNAVLGNAIRNFVHHEDNGIPTVNEWERNQASLPSQLTVDMNVYASVAVPAPIISVTN